MIIKIENGRAMFYLQEPDEGFILNTHLGLLHTADCANGLTGCEPVKAGRRKHYSSYETLLMMRLIKVIIRIALGN